MHLPRRLGGAPLSVCRFLLTLLACGSLRVAVVAHAEDPRGVRPGREVVIRGEVVEVGCYLRDGSRGEGHKTCALTCLKNGGQLGIAEDGSGLLYPVTGSRPASDPSEGLRELIAAHVEVRGRLYERAGSRALVVEETERLGE